MSGEFPGYAADMAAPAMGVSTITPSDSVDLPSPCRGIWVGVAGDITLDGVIAGTAVTLHNVPIGILPIAATRVYATGTDATYLVALF